MTEKKKLRQRRERILKFIKEDLISDDLLLLSPRYLKIFIQGSRVYLRYGTSVLCYCELSIRVNEDGIRYYASYVDSGEDECGKTTQPELYHTIIPKFLGKTEFLMI